MYFYLHGTAVYIKAASIIHGIICMTDRDPREKSQDSIQKYIQSEVEVVNYYFYTVEAFDDGKQKHNQNKNKQLYAECGGKTKI